MSETPADETRARLQHTLDQLREGDTLILAHHNSAGGAITHTIGCDPARLVDTARTLLDQAVDLLDDAPATAANRKLLACASAALEELPDPHADDDDEDEDSDVVRGVP